MFSKITNYTSEHSVMLLFDILYSYCFRLEYQENLELFKKDGIGTFFNKTNN